VGGSDTPRQSMDSRRSTSFGFGRKRSGSISGSQTVNSQEKTRRFSLLPASFSLKAIGIGKDYGTPGAPPSDDQDYDPRPNSDGNFLDTGDRGQSRPDEYPGGDGAYDSPVPQERRGVSASAPRQQPPQQQRYASQGALPNAQMSGVNAQYPMPAFRQGESSLHNGSDSSIDNLNRKGPNYPPGFNEDDGENRRPASGRPNRGVLQKNNRRFADEEPDHTYGGGGHNAGSSGAARKVMDFFRRRGKARGGD